MSTARVTCTGCQKEFDVPTEYFQKFGREPYCRDCLIHTECQSCGDGLRIQPSRFQELGGDPVVCTGCQSTDESSSTMASRTFWAGLSTGEKIVFPILLVVLVVALGLVANSAMNGGDPSGAGLTGVLILLYWTYRRGRKNRPN